MHTKSYCPKNYGPLRAFGLLLAVAALLCLLPHPALAQDARVVQDEHQRLEDAARLAKEMYRAHPTDEAKQVALRAHEALERFERDNLLAMKRALAAQSLAKGASLVAPANDDLANAVIIASTPFAVTGTNVDATKETNEATGSCGSDGDASVWWSFTPGTDGTLLVNTGGSNYDTFLTIWTGASHPLTQVDCNDDGGPGLTSKTETPVTAGTTYHIRVAGFSTSEGNITLSVDLMLPLPPYTVIDSNEAGGPSVNFNTIGPGNDLSLGDDNFATVPIGFTFNFYGEDYTHMPVTSNGYLNPTGDNPTNFTEACPIVSSSTPNGVIAPLWDDLNPATGGSVHAASFGSCPTGSYSCGPCFVAEWNNVPEWIATGSNTFQSILYPDGTIEYQYDSITAGDGTVGIEAHTGFDGLTYACGASPVSAHLAIRFNPPPCDFDRLQAEVQALVDDGTLNRGQGNSLIVKVNAAEQQFNRCNGNTAINQLNAFINEVEALRNAGRLTDAQADALIDCAQAVIDRINLLYPQQARVEGAEQAPQSLPGDFEIGAYPNPFNPATTITYTMAEAGRVQMVVYDMLGREVARLVDGAVEAGTHQVAFAAGELASGTYLVRLATPQRSLTRPVVLMK